MEGPSGRKKKKKIGIAIKTIKKTFPYTAKWKKLRTRKNGIGQGAKDLISKT